MREIQKAVLFDLNWKYYKKLTQLNFMQPK